MIMTSLLGSVTIIFKTSCEQSVHRGASPLPAIDALLHAMTTRLEPAARCINQHDVLPARACIHRFQGIV